LEFSAQADFEEDSALVRLEDDLRLASLAYGPPALLPKLPKRLKWEIGPPALRRHKGPFTVTLGVAP
jgi:hypothetical protein